MSPHAVLSEEERAAAFAGPPPKVPRKAVVSLVAACLVLGLGGLVVDHFFGGASGASPSSGGTNPPAFPGTLAGQKGQLGSSTNAMMGLRPVKVLKAPGISLVDAGGRSVSLSSFRGKVVVLTFFDARCDDICPVLESEIRSAAGTLAKRGDSSRVEFLTVNTDPLATSVADAQAAVQRMGSVAGWAFLTGSVRRLNAVWKGFGVSVDVQASTGTISHSEVMYFIDQTGRFRARALPFADEVGKQSYVLPAPMIRRFGGGIAAEAERLLGRGAA